MLNLLAGLESCARTLWFAGSSFVNRTVWPARTASTCGSKMKRRWFNVTGDGGGDELFGASGR